LIYGATVAKSWRIGVASLPIRDWLDEALTTRSMPSTEMAWTESHTPGEFYADPITFAGTKEDRVLFERYRPWRGRGEICVGTIAAGEIRDIGPIVSKPLVHFAFPSTQAGNGVIYTVPDSDYFPSHSPLYVGESPTSLVLLGPIASVPRLKDPVLQWLGDRYWLFGLEGRRELTRSVVFWSNDPKGEWTPVPSVIDGSGVARRSAGPIVEMGGRLIRPRQEGATNYGQAVTLTEITELSEDCYDERDLLTLTPPDDWPARDGFHTLSGTDRWTVVDACIDTRATLAGVHRVLGRGRSRIWATIGGRSSESE